MQFYSKISPNWLISTVFKNTPKLNKESLMYFYTLPVWYLNLVARIVWTTNLLVSQVVVYKLWVISS